MFTALLMPWVSFHHPATSGWFEGGCEIRSIGGYDGQQIDPALVPDWSPHKIWYDDYAWVAMKNEGYDLR